MKFTLDKQEFVNALDWAASVAETKATKIELSNVLIQAKKGGLELLTTNLEVGMRVRCPADVKKVGDIAVPAKKLLDLVKKLDADELSFGIQEGRLDISGGTAHYDLVSTPPEDVPIPPEHDLSDFMEFPSYVLLEMLERTEFAATNDPSRPALSGVLFEMTKGADGHVFKMVATDAHRMCIAQHPWTEEIPEFKHVVPKRAIREIERLLNNYDKVEVSFKAGDIIFKAGKEADVVLNARLIAGEFPDYQRVIPEPGPNRLIVPVDKLIASLRRLEEVTSRDVPGVRMGLDPKEVTFSAMNPSIGGGEERPDCTYEGEPFMVMFNLRFLLEIAEVMDKDSEIVIELTDARRAARIMQRDEPNFLSVIMPMQLPEGL